MTPDINEFQHELSELTNQINDKICEQVSELRHQMIMFNSVTYSAAESNLQKSHSFLTGMKEKWSLLEDFCTCMKMHINDTSEYHLFYQNLFEYQKLMELSMMETWDQFRIIEDDDEVEHFYENIQENLTVFLQWWQRIDNIIARSRTLIPISLRRNPIDIKLPAKMLISFKAEKLAFNENENVFVCKSFDRDLWEIENLRGIKDCVPSICVQLCGPETEGIEQAVSLRLTLMNNWTVTLKEVSKSLIKFVQFKIMGSSKAEKTDSKTDILQHLNDIEETLQTLGLTNPDFEIFHEKVHGMRVALSIYSDEDIVDDDTIIEINDMFLQICFFELQSQNVQNEDVSSLEQHQCIAQLIQKYIEFIKFWEMYKIIIENSNNPNYFWMFEDFHKLKSVNISELFNFISKEDKDMWSSYINLLSIHDFQKSIDSSKIESLNLNSKSRWSSTQSFQLPNKLHNPKMHFYTSNIELQHLPNDFKERNCLSSSLNTFGSWSKKSGLFGHKNSDSDKDSVFIRQESNESLNNMYQERKRVTTEHISSRKKIEKVVHRQYLSQSTSFSNPNKHQLTKKNSNSLSQCCIRDALTDEPYTLQQAIDMGIINQEEDRYYDRLTQIHIPISMALMKGYISSPLVENEKTESLSRGIISILNPSYEKSDVVKSILDKKGRMQKSIDEAKLLGLTNQSMSRFINTLSGRKMNFDQAVSENIITIDFNSKGLSSYIVYSVMDNKRKMKINFRDALDWGLLNADKGCYFNSFTGENLQIIEAIQCGLINAELIKDVNKISEISPENWLLIYDGMKLNC